MAWPEKRRPHTIMVDPSGVKKASAVNIGIKRSKPERHLHSLKWCPTPDTSPQLEVDKHFKLAEEVAGDAEKCVNCSSVPLRHDS